ncbi:hypothetical protein [Streptomyces sp. NPDC001759]
MVLAGPCASRRTGPLHSDTRITRITRDIYQSVVPEVGKSAAEATAEK